MTSSRPYLLRANQEWITDNGLTPLILVDANHPDTEVPVEYVQDGRIVLNISMSAVSGWQADNHRLSFSARFGGVPRQLSVPVDAVLAIYARENGKGMAFGPADEPDPEPPKPSADKQQDQDNERRSHLKVIK